MTGKIFVTRKIPAVGLDMLAGRAGLEVDVYQKDRVIPRRELLKRIRGCAGVLTLLTEKVDQEFLEAAGPQLKVVANMAVGYDNIDVHACKNAGVAVANTPGVLTDAVAEHAFALMMAIARRIVESDKFLRAGKYEAWGPLLLLGTQLKGKTLGVVGLGRIGAGVAERAAKGMGMKVLYNDVKRNEDFERSVGAEFAAVEDILRRSDFVSIHVPLLPATRHLVDAAKLAMMKPTAYLVNTSRGPIVDEKALVAALKSKRIAGAALDVFEFEPKLAPGLAKLDNVVITPHTASATFEARSAMAELAAQAILDALDGKTPKNLVTL
ncbi:D-glycerate dehydrogenase [Candidatus Uhrbacteria bacterium]|nr:D-glycerate dehydrogenase [Candidatus Uhrbacteria bacterium]